MKSEDYSELFTIDYDQSLFHPSFRDFLFIFIY